MSADRAKQAAADAAAALVRDGNRVGLGTGSTARWFIVSLGRRVREGLRITAVATSGESERLATASGIALDELDDRGLDLAADGADAVDPELRLIKGAGGAMVRERIVAAAARRFVVIVDAAKLRPRLAGRVPVEVLPFGAEHTLSRLTKTGAPFAWRTTAEGAPLRSDNGNLIADGEYPMIADPGGLAAQLDALPGVVGHGLFIAMTDLVLVGDDRGNVRHLSRKPRP